MGVWEWAGSVDIWVVDIGGRLVGGRPWAALDVGGPWVVWDGGRWAGKTSGLAVTEWVTEALTEWVTEGVTE